MRKLTLVFLFVASFLVFPQLIFAHGGVNDKDLIIRMTKNGFEPKELTVVEGDEVLFINNDEVDHWPASNFHPTHTLYPEFDPLKGIKPGESWKMKFEKVGTWRMHDHLFPHFTGTIVVLQDPGKATTTAQIVSSIDTPQGEVGFWAQIKAVLTRVLHIFGKKNTQASSTQVDEKLLAEFKSKDEKDKYTWLETRAKEENPKVAWNYVLAAYKTPDGVVGNPHDMAHLVGQLLYKKYGLEGLSTCTPDFAFGCYHGLMEVAFDSDRGNEAKYQADLAEAEKGCQDVGPETSPSYWSCIHGMGHGIATYRDHELDPALKDCDSLKGKIQTYCHDGVFMEFSISAPANFYKESDPIYPCDAIGNNYKIACARSQVQVMRNRMGFGTAQISNACNKSGNADIIYHCIDALGYYAAQTSTTNPEHIVAECKKISNPDLAGQCTAAAAGELVFEDAAGWRENSVKVCDSLESKYRPACSDRITQIKTSYGRK